MNNNITNLKRALGAGARVNKYRVKLTFPTAVGAKSELQNIDVLCKSASFPSKTIAAVDTFSQGRKLPLPGDTSFENTWALTFYNTEGHDLRRDFLKWMKDTDNFQQNLHSGVPADLMTEMSVAQLDSYQNETTVYTFHNVWVSEVSSIDVSDDTDGGIQEFSVTFTYSDWVVGNEEFDKPEVANKPTLNPIAE